MQRLLELSRAANVYLSFSRSLEQSPCLKRFARFSALCWVFVTTEASAQSSSLGLTVEEARDALAPVTTALAWLLSLAVNTFIYIMEHPPAAILLAAAIAGYVALRGVRFQRQIARLRETFATIDRGVWDKDHIQALKDFKVVRTRLAESKESIAKFANPSCEQDIATATTLGVILRDYENLAIGIRYDIIDEEYLHRWLRSTLIHDWLVFAPMVTAYRNSGSPNAYTEFEGLAAAWQHNCSFRTGRKLKRKWRLLRVH